jgi:hypothetical protein
MHTFVVSITKCADSVVALLSTPLCQKRAWVLWSLFAAVILCINCYTLTISPIIWQDEVQIIDAGRSSLPGSDLTWGMQWANEGRPVHFLFFLGAMVQELAYRCFPDGMFGARFAAELALVFGSGALMGWMIARGVLPVISLLSSILWLVEPTLTQGVRGSRVDALAMMFVFLACWGVAAIPSQRLDPATFGRLGSAGVNLGLALLVWPSSALMIPLFLNELLEKTIKDQRNALDRFVTALLKMGWVSIGSVATLAVAIACRPGHRVQEISDFRDGMVVTASVSLASASVWMHGLRTFMVSLKASPWLIAFSFYGMVLQRRWRLLAFVCLTMLCIIATRVYFYRAVYVIPILMVTSIVVANSILTDYAHHKAGAFRVVLVAGFLVVSVGLSLGLLGARTYIARKERSTRNPGVIYALAESTIGRGPLRIYVGPWEFYYPGRRLGWKMFRNHASNRSLDWGRMTQFLDCAILKSSQLSGDIASELTKHGFLKTTLRPNLGLHPSADTGSSIAGKNYDRDYILYFRPGFQPSRPTPFY